MAYYKKKKKQNSDLIIVTYIDRRNEKKIKQITLTQNQLEWWKTQCKVIQVQYLLSI